MSDFDVNVSVEDIIGGHKSLRERAKAADEARKEEKAAEIEALAEDLKCAALELAIEILEIDPRDASNIEFRRMASTSEGKPVVGFTFDKLNFRVRSISERQSDNQYEDIAIIEYQRTGISWTRIQSLADLGKHL